MSVQEGKAGEFVAVIDLKDWSWSRCPPVWMLREAIGLLKRHYPYRLGGLFLVNAPGAFTFVWNLLKPFMPSRALSKTFFPTNHKELVRIMDEKLGRNFVEDSYGGLVEEDLSDVNAYIENGYWHANTCNAGFAEAEA
jgi:CRAL/TRIO domain